MKKKYSYILNMSLLLFFYGCGDEGFNKTNKIDEKKIRPDSIVEKPPILKRKDFSDTNIEDTIRTLPYKLFKSKMIVSSSDSIITHNISRTKEKNCVNWDIPSKKEIMILLTSFYEISGRDWNDCYGDWSCGVSGKIFYENRIYNYRLDAGGWIILSNKKEQRYFGCTSQDSRKYFPSDCFCDENGLIGE